MRSLERVNIRTNVRMYVRTHIHTYGTDPISPPQLCCAVRTYVLTYIRMGQTLYPLHNFVVRGDKKDVSYLVRLLNKVCTICIKPADFR